MVVWVAWDQGAMPILMLCRSTFPGIARMTHCSWLFTPVESHAAPAESHAVKDSDGHITMFKFVQWIW